MQNPVTSCQPPSAESEYMIFCHKMVLVLENFVLLRFAANLNNNVREHYEADLNQCS